MSHVDAWLILFYCIISICVHNNAEGYFNAELKTIDSKYEVTRNSKMNIRGIDHDNKNVAASLDSSLNKTLPRFKHTEKMHKFNAKPAGNFIKFKCPAEGNPSPNITWLKNGETPRRDLGIINRSRWTLALEDLTKNDEGNYTCMVCNEIGCINFTFMLEVVERLTHKPVLTEAPKNQTKLVGDNATFVCEFLSDLFTHIQWMKYPPGTLNFSVTYENMVKVKTDNPSVLELTNLTKEDEGLYVCIVTNSLGAASAKAYLNVVEHSLDSSLNKTLPRFKHTEKMHKFNAKPAGNFIKFKCPAEGNPSPNITWLKNGETPRRDLGIINRSRWTFELEDLGTFDNGNYTCVVCNEIGCINYTFKLEVVERFPSKPYIKEGFPGNKTVLVNTTVRFHCPQTSDLEPHIQWRRVFNDTVDEEHIPNGTILKTNTNNPSVLELTNVTMEDEGLYVCIAGNSLGQTFAKAYLIVVELHPTEVEDQFLDTTTIIVILILCVIIISIIIFCVHKNKKREQHLAAEIPLVKIEKLMQFLPQSINGNFGHNDQYRLRHDDDWELPRELLTFCRVLSEGEFGKTVLAEGDGLLQQGVNSVVVVKMLKDGHSDADMLALVSEMENMKLIGKHINIINLLGCCTQNGPLYIVVEYAPHGNLRDLLINSRVEIVNESTFTFKNTVKTMSAFSRKDLVSFSCQIARGMEYLASRRCVHSDLKAKNVLVSDNFVLKITNFGLANNNQSKEHYKEKTEEKQPSRWFAPESLYYRLFTTQSDVWSFGVVVWEIMTIGGIPYHTIPIQDVYEHLIAGNRLNKPERCSSEIYTLISNCWSFQSLNRPYFDDLAEKLDSIRDSTRV